MLLYQLLTDGNMDLDHIRTFSPSFERVVLFQKVSLDSLASPHVIKSHLEYRFIPKGCGRYIYVMRNGIDTAISLYYDLRRRSVVDTELHDFVNQFIEGRPYIENWFDHVSGWVANTSELNVLYVTYEELVDSFECVARAVARFCAIEPPESQWPRIARNCSFSFMRAHEDKFDEMPWTRANASVAEDFRFIRRGKVGHGRPMLDRELLRLYETQFNRTLGRVSAADALRG
jgi:hypothetical protein